MGDGCKNKHKFSFFAIRLIFSPRFVRFAPPLAAGVIYGVLYFVIQEEPVHPMEPLYGVRCGGGEERVIQRSKRIRTPNSFQWLIQMPRYKPCGTHLPPICWKGGGICAHYWIFLRADVTQKKYTDVTQNFPRKICVLFLRNICVKPKCPVV